MLRDGRKPLVLFGEPPEVVQELRSVRFDNHEVRDVVYRFCSEEHRATFRSWWAELS